MTQTMFDLIYKHLSDPHTVVALLVGVAAVATVITLGMPLLSTDTLAKRMKSVAVERECASLLRCWSPRL